MREYEQEEKATYEAFKRQLIAGGQSKAYEALIQQEAQEDDVEEWLTPETQEEIDMLLVRLEELHEITETFEG